MKVTESQNISHNAFVWANLPLKSDANPNDTSTRQQAKGRFIQRAVPRGTTQTMPDGTARYLNATQVNIQT
jgi:hypothetical protein